MNTEKYKYICTVAALSLGSVANRPIGTILGACIKGFKKYGYCRGLGQLGQLGWTSGAQRPSCYMQNYDYCCGLGQLGQLGRTFGAERPSLRCSKMCVFDWSRPTRPARPDFRGRAVELEMLANVCVLIGLGQLGQLGRASGAERPSLKC